MIHITKNSLETCIIHTLLQNTAKKYNKRLIVNFSSDSKLPITLRQALTRFDDVSFIWITGIKLKLEYLQGLKHIIKEYPKVKFIFVNNHINTKEEQRVIDFICGLKNVRCKIDSDKSLMEIVNDFLVSKHHLEIGFDQIIEWVNDYYNFGEKKFQGYLLNIVKEIYGFHLTKDIIEKGFVDYGLQEYAKTHIEKVKEYLSKLKAEQNLQKEDEVIVAITNKYYNDIPYLIKGIGYIIYIPELQILYVISINLDIYSIIEKSEIQKFAKEIITGINYYNKTAEINVKGNDENIIKIFEMISLISDTMKEV